MKNNLEYYFNFKNHSIKLISDDDFENTVNLINKAYSYQDEAKGRPRIDLTKLRNKANETSFYITLSKSRISGCFYIQPEEKKLHFGLLTVADEYRGKGLAPAIITSIEKYTKATGYETLDLDYISLALWLKKYYQKYGFELTGKTVNWGEIDLINMSKSFK